MNPDGLRTVIPVGGSGESVDGEPQLTIDGRPLYTYVGDEAPGDVSGQGVEDVWFAVAPDGTAITAVDDAPGY